MSDFKTLKEFLIVEQTEQEEYYMQCDIRISVESIEKDIISLGLNNYVNFQGGQYPNQGLTCMNFNLKDGSEIKLNQLLITGFEAKLNRIAEKLFVESYGSEGNYYFQPGTYELIENFSIQKNGFTFYFNPYPDNGTHISMCSVFIPYSDIKDLILPEGLLFKLLQK
jgi:hypothetical protein